MPGRDFRAQPKRDNLLNAELMIVHWRMICRRFFTHHVPSSQRLNESNETEEKHIIFKFEFTIFLLISQFHSPMTSIEPVAPSAIIAPPLSPWQLNSRFEKKISKLYVECHHV